MVDVYCKHCNSDQTYLYAEIKDGINNKHKKVYECPDCKKRTIVLIQNGLTQIQ